MLIDILERRSLALKSADFHEICSASHDIRSLFQQKLSLSGSLSAMTRSEFDGVNHLMDQHKMWKSTVPLGELFLNNILPEVAAECILCDDWNYTTDILVVLSSDYFSCKICEVLKSYGQKNIIYLSPADEDDVFSAIAKHEVLNSINRDHSRKFAFAVSPDAKLIEHLHSAVQRIKEIHTRNEATVAHLNDRWINNAVENLQFHNRFTSLAPVMQAFKSRSTLVISPGPSLLKAKPFLRELANKFNIVCVGQAVPALTAEGITPDFVIVTDPHDFSDVMKGFDFDKCNGLICSELIHPNFLSLPFKKLFIHSPHYSPLSLQNFLDIRIDRFYGGSVSVTALHLAIKFGSPEIAILGQDLSLSDGGQYAFTGESKSLKNGKYIKSKGITYFQLHNGTRMKIYKVKGWNGETLLTREDYWNYKKETEKLLKNQKDGTIKFINFSKGGANISGFENYDISKWLHINPAEGCKKPVLSSEGQFYIEHYKTYINEIIEKDTQIQLELKSSENSISRECLTYAKTDHHLSMFVPFNQYDFYAKNIHLDYNSLGEIEKRVFSEIVLETLHKRSSFLLKALNKIN